MTFALGFANSSAIRWSLVSASSPLLWASARMPECPGFRFRGCGGHAGHHSRRHRLRARSIAAAAPGHASGRPQGDGLGVRGRRLRSALVVSEVAWRCSCCAAPARSEEHTSELQSLTNLVCRLLLEKKKMKLRHAPPLDVLDRQRDAMRTGGKRRQDTESMDLVERQLTVYSIVLSG